VLGADMTDKDRAKAFDKMNTDVKIMIAQHLQRLDKALATDRSTATQVHEDVAEELKLQETDDKELKKEEDAAMHDVATGNFHHLDHKKASKEIDEIEARMTAVFHHVDDLANKMGSTDIDALLESSHVAEWEQLLTDTESGKVAYPIGIKKMEAILDKIPAALKLAEATGSKTHRGRWRQEGRHRDHQLPQPTQGGEAPTAVRRGARGVRRLEEGAPHCAAGSSLGAEEH